MSLFIQYSIIIWVFMLLGAALRWRDESIQRFTRPLLQVDALIYTPSILFLAGWSFDYERFGPISFLMPFIGFAVSGSAMWLGILYARRSSLSPPQRGSFVAAATVSNVGLTFGMSLCYALFGKQGLALSGLYVLYFPFLIHVVLFGMADRWRQSHEGKEVAPAKITSLFLQLLTDPYRCLPLIVFGSGFLLNFTVGRETIPTWLDIAAEKMILLNLFTSFLAVGFTLKVGNIAIYAKPILALAGIKFIASPLIAIIACQAIGLTDKPFTVVIIEAACPVGIFSVLTAALYRQDAELAGAALVSTTAFATVSALILIPQFIN